MFKKYRAGVKPAEKIKITPAKARRIYVMAMGKMIFMIITPIVLLILPVDFFDKGPSLCLSQLLFGRECPACGITRGIMHLIHLDFENAYAYNMMSFIVLPLLILSWVQWFLRELRIYKKLKVALSAIAPAATAS